MKSALKHLYSPQRVSSVALTALHAQAPNEVHSVCTRVSVAEATFTLVYTY